MSNAVATLTYADVPGFPAGSVVDHVDVSITNTATSAVTTQHVAPGTAAVTFSNVDPGSYTASAQALDGSGNTLGTAVTASFSITAPGTVSLSLPASLVVAQA